MARSHRHSCLWQVTPPVPPAGIAERRIALHTGIVELLQCRYLSCPKRDVASSHACRCAAPVADDTHRHDCLGGRGDRGFRVCRTSRTGYSRVRNPSAVGIPAVHISSLVADSLSELRRNDSVCVVCTRKLAGRRVGERRSVFSGDRNGPVGPVVLYQPLAGYDLESA
jgi:hypothetical protein